MPETKKTHRSPEARIQDLMQKIEGIRTRAERKQARAKPEVRHALAATKALDKAMAATTDAALRTAFQEARSTVAAAVAVTGLVVPESTTKAAAPQPGRRKKQRLSG